MATGSRNPDILNSKIQKSPFLKRSKAFKNLVVLTPTHVQCHSSLPRYRHPDFWSRGEESTVLGADVYGPIVAPFLIDQSSQQLTNSFSFLGINSCVTVMSTVQHYSFWSMLIIFYFNFTFSF